jgi:hypothetical protein
VRLIGLDHEHGRVDRAWNRHVHAEVFGDHRVTQHDVTGAHDDAGRPRVIRARRLAFEMQ